MDENGTILAQSRSWQTLGPGLRVKVGGLIKAAQYNGLEAIAKTLLSDGLVRLILDGLDGKEISVKFEYAFIISCIYCKEKNPHPIGCGCKGTIADVQDGAFVAHISCRANHFLEVAKAQADDTRFDLFRIFRLQRMWCKCPKCNQTFKTEMRIGDVDIKHK